MRKLAAKLTEIDQKALRLIEACGHVRLDGDEPCLETNTQITPYRFKRLEKLGLVKPSNDALFGQSQTWRLTAEEGLHEGH